jgi:hypothetical protein
MSCFPAGRGLVRDNSLEEFTQRINDKETPVGTLWNLLKKTLRMSEWRSDGTETFEEQAHAIGALLGKESQSMFRWIHPHNSFLKKSWLIDA